MSKAKWLHWENSAPRGNGRSEVKVSHIDKTTPHDETARNYKAAQTASDWKYEKISININSYLQEKFSRTLKLILLHKLKS